MQDKDEIESSCVYDIDVAATLVAKGYKLSSIEREAGKKVGFFFTRTPELKEIISAYWFNKIYVHPLEFATARKNLKSQLFGLPTIEY
jgi:hypothetical protein